MFADRLTKAWSNRRKSTDIDVIMRFADEGLVLGAGTLLTPVGQARGRVLIDPEDPRLVALLAAIHLGRPTALSLAHLCKAAERWSDGDDGFCAMHLALSRIERLKHPQADAYRLFLADELMREGVGAAAIIKAIMSGDLDFERLCAIASVMSSTIRWANTTMTIGANIGSGNAKCLRRGTTMPNLKWS